MTKFGTSEYSLALLKLSNGDILAVNRGREEIHLINKVL